MEIYVLGALALAVLFVAWILYRISMSILSKNLFTSEEGLDKIVAQQVEEVRTRNTSVEVVRIPLTQPDFEKPILIVERRD